MSGGAVLAQLMAQASERGAELVTLRAIAEEAGELGATRALTRRGLAGERAARDMAELRELLAAWRDAKKSAWKSVFGWLCALLLAVLAVKLDFAEYVK